MKLKHLKSVKTDTALQMINGFKEHPIHTIFSAFFDLHDLRTIADKKKYRMKFFMASTLSTKKPVILLQVKKTGDKISSTYYLPTKLDYNAGKAKQFKKVISNPLPLSNLEKKLTFEIDKAKYMLQNLAKRKAKLPLKCNCGWAKFDHLPNDLTSRLVTGMKFYIAAFPYEEKGGPAFCPNILQEMQIGDPSFAYSYPTKLCPPPSIGCSPD